MKNKIKNIDILDLKNRKYPNHMYATNDYMFKRIFGKVGNEEITKAFLKDILDVEYTDITLNDNPILLGENYLDKNAELDVKLTANGTTQVDIEMQMISYDYLPKRILWYWARMYGSSLKQGQSYKNAKKTICILIINDRIKDFKNVPTIQSNWQITEKKYSTEILTDDFGISIIELGKFNDSNISQEEKDRLEKWIVFFKNPEYLDEETLNSNGGIKMANEELNKLRESEFENSAALRREMVMLEENTLFQEGIDKGIEKGTKIRNYEIVKRMLAKNMSSEEISDLIGLSKEEVDNIIKDIEDDTKE